MAPCPEIAKSSASSRPLSIQVWMQKVPRGTARTNWRGVLPSVKAMPARSQRATVSVMGNLRRFYPSVGCYSYADGMRQTRTGGHLEHRPPGRCTALAGDAGADGMVGGSIAKRILNLIKYIRCSRHWRD